MPHVEIAIGGRTFEVACQEGEEHFLHSAAAMLNDEASHMSAQIGRMPEARMLLMAGLMLADKTAGLEEKVKDGEARMAHLQAQIETLESTPAISTQVEVAVIPTSVTDAMALIAARTEALAAEVERRAG
ncbi:cell division protein ZapA [Yoonia sp.]|uniref:cell division protein ZapA n=1 Tax=Yoonia sp. TaxID=2212373 RepID=UPI002387198B|nr:cell division protein ZapA [Yoonia sp.]MDE0850361.1 cell division protein ZapA [Yoonia sp.]